MSKYRQTKMENVKMGETIRVQSIVGEFYEFKLTAKGEFIDTHRTHKMFWKQYIVGDSGTHSMLYAVTGTIVDVLIED